MSLLYSDDSDIIYWPEDDLHDPLSSKYYSLDYRPDTWQVSTVYIKDRDLVIPVIANGCMYECISGGKSDLITPTYPTVEGRSFKDGDVLWKTLPFAAKLGYGDTITASTWTASDGVSISDSEIVSSKTTIIKVTAVPLYSTEFTLTNIVTVNRTTGRVEVFKKTINIKIGNL